MRNIRVFGGAILLSLSAFGWAQSSETTNTISLNAGERMRIALVQDKEGAEALRATYLENVMPIAAQHGVKYLNAMQVDKLLTGDHNAQNLAFYSWPNAEAAKASGQDPTYVTQFKKMEPEAWDELTLIDIDLDKDLNFELDPGKTYTFAEVWIGSKSTYDAYIQATDALRDALGAKIVFKLHPSEYSSINKGVTPPHLAVLVEWDTAEGPQQYLDAPEFQEVTNLVQFSIRHIEWYQLSLY